MTETSKVADGVRGSRESGAAANEAIRSQHFGSKHLLRVPNTERSPSVRYVWYVIGLLSLVNVFNYMDRMALAILSPFVRRDLHLSDTQLGLLVGLAFAVFYALCGVPVARLADRGNRRNIVAGALVVWSSMTALCGGAQNFLQLFLARVGVGAGEAGGLPPAQSMICDYVPLKGRSAAFALHSLGIYVGTMIGMALAGWLAEVIGWRMTFVVLGLPGVALAIFLRFSVREPARGCFEAVTDDGAPSLRETFRILWQCATYRFLVLFDVVNGFVQYGLNQWLPSYYAREFAVSLSEVGLRLGIALGVGAGIGLLLGGLFANKLTRRNLSLPLLVGATTTLCAVPPAFGALFSASVSTSVSLLFLTALLWSVSNAPVIAAVYSVVRPRIRATAGAVAIFLTSVLGFGLGPFSVGLLSDLLAPAFGVEALRYALLVPVSFIPIMAAALFLAARSLRSDLNAVSTLTIDDSARVSVDPGLQGEITPGSRIAVRGGQ
ncbi:spinster family MFS transporter [Steroidobacter flavus]|uniref:Spinster family MFS transporter n=1 Tax=Steroidobacter flavus TaxID=1842136 RepID=A0ABV8SVV3_9GAMM